MKSASSNHNDQLRAVLLGPSAGERFDIIGGGIRILVDGEATGGHCCMFECPVPPGDGPPLHTHQREDEMFFVLEGTFKFSIDGKEFIGEAGSFALAPRKSIHSFKNVGKTLGRLHVTCTPAGLEVPFRAVQVPAPHSGKKALSPEEIAEIFAKYGVTFVGPPL